jgi:hypothetical protein
LTLLVIFFGIVWPLGEVAYSLKIRTTAIGIREVPDAYTRTTVQTLFRSFIKIVRIATVITLPVALSGDALWLLSYPCIGGFGFVAPMLGNAGVS